MGLKKGFVVTAISEVVYKFMSTLYVTVTVRTNAAKAKAKCEAVGNGAFGVMRVTRRNEKILVFVSRFSIKICFYEAILV